MVVPMTDAKTVLNFCDSCANGIHTQCINYDTISYDFNSRGVGDCNCIHPIHRIEYEDGDTLERLIGRLRGCIQLLVEMPVSNAPINCDVIVGRNLEDIAKRLDGVNDNLAVVAHLLNNPMAGHWQGGMLRISLD